MDTEIMKTLSLISTTFTTKSIVYCEEPKINISPRDGGCSLFDIGYVPYSSYNEVQDHIVLSSNCPPEYNDGGEDLSNIVHELGHAFHDALIIGDLMGSNHFDLYGITEGIGDYLAISYRRLISNYNPNRRFNWWMSEEICNELGINCNGIYSALDWNFESDGNGDGWEISEIYDQGRTWASSMMELEYNDPTDPAQGFRLGHDVTITLQMGLLSYVTDASDLLQYVYALYQADRDIYHGEHIPDLINVFHNRQLFDNQLINENVLTDVNWSIYKLITDDILVTNNSTLTIEPFTYVVSEGNLELENGSTLIIGEGAELHFKSETGLIVDGTSTLIINGTIDNEVILSNISNSSNWNGVHITDGQAYINYVTISYADYGLTISGTNNIEIINSEFKNNIMGIGLFPANYNCLVENNKIHNNQMLGIIGISTNSRITGNAIYNNDYAGIYLLSGSNPVITNNEIFENGDENCTHCSGIVLYNSSPILSTKKPNIIFIQPPVNNLFYNNIHSQISCNSQSAPNMGVYNETQYNIYGGFNHFYQYNYSIERDYLLDPPMLYAQLNYWHSDLANSAGPLFIDETISWQPTAPEVIDLAYDDDNLLTQEGLKKEQEGLYDEAIVYFQESISQYEDPSNSLAGLERCYDSIDQTGEWIELLLLYHDHIQEDIRILAGLYLIWAYHKIGLIEDAITLAENLMMQYVDTEYEVYFALELAILEEGWTSNSTLGKIGEETTYITEKSNDGATLIMKKYPNSIQSTILELLGIESSRDSQISNTIEFSQIESSYPNPFNPTTTISYNILNKGNVSLIVYDLMGREIEKLVNTIQLPGNYQRKWDASEYSSGVYLVQLISEEYRSVQKLMLIK